MRIYIKGKAYQVFEEIAIMATLYPTMAIKELVSKLNQGGSN